MTGAHTKAPKGTTDPLRALVFSMVEGKGFEPSASGVRFQRSPGLS